MTDSSAMASNDNYNNNNNPGEGNGSGGPSALDALAKAKAIAAKLAQTSALQMSSGGGIPGGSSSGGIGSGVGGDESGFSIKRKRWAVDEDAVSQEGDADKRSKSEDKCVKKVWIPADKNPGYNYVGLLIGPGGSKQKALQAEAGGRVKIQVRGQGSSGSNPDQRGGEEPLHVLLEGEKDCVEKAEVLINELLSDSAKADAEKGRQLAELGIAHSSPSGNPGSSSANPPLASSAYKPLPVAQLIGQAMAGPNYDTQEEKMGVPNGVVGYIIGKGGESITSMQRRTGCRVQIQKEHEMTPGSNTRVITLTAPTAEQINQCRTIIEQMVQERHRLNQQQQQTSTITTTQNQLTQALAQGQQLLNMQVPDADVGLIIGKGGINIRSMQDRSGANIQIPPHADADNPLVRTISITHPTLDGANFAKQMVEDILRNKTAPTPNAADASVQVLIPDKDVGMVIGRSGCVIREMQSKTRTRIQIPSQPTPGQANRVATVSGPADGCQQVKQMIERMVMEQSSQSVMTGTNFTSNFMQAGQQAMMMQQPGMNMGMQYGQYGGQSYLGQTAMYGQQQPGSMYGGQYAQGNLYGQQYSAYGAAAPNATAYAQSAQQSTSAAAGGQQKTDYSAEWAAYYAAQAAQQGTSGSNTAATPTSSSTAGTTAAPTPAPSSSAQTASPTPASDASGAASSQQQGQQTDPTAYYDAFWRYAAYYGEDAARKYYGAWSPPAGTPNPYASQGGASAAPTQQQQQQQSSNSDPKDSSARKVSNLPAWMTKS